MANRVILMGRLTKEPDLKYSSTNSEMAICRYTLAVPRRGKDKECDFINCIAFGKSGEFASQYFTKGLRVYIEGHIQTGSYENKEGKKVYTTDVIIESQEFADAPKQGKVESTAPALDTFEDNVDEDEIPF